MRHFLFNGTESPDEIKRILADNSDGRETMTYPKQLTEGELTALRENLADNHIEIGKANDELAEAKKEHKDFVKPLQVENKEILKTLKTRYQEVTENVYKLPNHVSGMMEFVNEKGDIVGSRKLRPEERQGNVFSMSRAANE